MKGEEEEEEKEEEEEEAVVLKKYIFHKNNVHFKSLKKYKHQFLVRKKEKLGVTHPRHWRNGRDATAMATTNPFY